MFVAEYLVDFNGTQAAMRAGYSRRGVGNPGRLLSTPLIAAAVRAAIKARVDRLAIDADDVLLRALMIYDMGMTAQPVKKWHAASNRYVETGDYTFDGALAVKALELIGKLLGAFRDRAPGDEPPFVIHIHGEVDG